MAEHRHWTPQQLWEMTPHELLAIFGVAKNRQSGRIDNPLELLLKANELRAAKGLKPVAPSWLLPKLDRRRKQNG